MYVTRSHLTPSRSYPNDRLPEILFFEADRIEHSSANGTLGAVEHFGGKLGWSGRARFHHCNLVARKIANSQKISVGNRNAGSASSAGSAGPKGLGNLAQASMKPNLSRARCEKVFLKV